METPHLLLLLLPLLLLLRFHSFLLFLGQPSSSVRDIKVTTFCRIISEFSLEYRTTRERVLTLKRKRAAHRERTKTRGKMITEVTLLLSLLLLTDLQLLWEGGQQQDLLSFLFHHIISLLLFLSSCVSDGEVFRGGASARQPLPGLHGSRGGAWSGGGA